MSYLSRERMEQALQSGNGVAQLVKLDRRQLQPADVEVAVIMRGPDGRYTHRRMRCVGKDLYGATNALLDPDLHEVLAPFAGKAVRTAIGGRSSLRHPR